MLDVVREKWGLWRSSKRGFTTRFNKNRLRPAADRPDIDDIIVSRKLERGGNLQKARLRFYPSIDVDYGKLFAGKMEGTLEEADELLLQMGYRNNPTSYVEVTDEHGPDDGSYARQIVTEAGGGIDTPSILPSPSVFRRVKRQIHVTVYQVNDEVHFLAHDEISAWLQPVRHVIVGDTESRIGVRDFRDDWFDEFDEELGGKQEVNWQTTH